MVSRLDEQAKVRWLTNDAKHTVSSIVLVNWLKFGPRPVSLSNETEFCDAAMLRHILELKTSMDGFNGRIVTRQAKLSNPNEQMRRSSFEFGGAVKMEDIDSMVASIFTKPADKDGNSLLNGPLTFVDVCGGPGGFTEYIMRRCDHKAIGIGFTLRRYNDFRFHSDSFRPYYGIKGDGNIYDPQNIESFEQYVLKTHPKGVHVVMADGGFEVKEKNIQEIKSKQLYVCQCLVALSILQERGNFVVKLFDVYSRFSVGLMFLMRQCFKQMCIVKPKTSRPANSERYLICQYKIRDTHTVRQHLFDVNCRFWSNKNSDLDIVELVPMDVLMGDKDFYNYIVESNNAIGQKQFETLHEIVQSLNKACT